jgi:hypothetical protein
MCPNPKSNPNKLPKNTKGEKFDLKGMMDLHSRDLFLSHVPYQMNQRSVLLKSMGEYFTYTTRTHTKSWIYPKQ